MVEFQISLEENVSYRAMAGNYSQEFEVKGEVTTPEKQEKQERHIISFYVIGSVVGVLGLLLAILWKFK